jgi:nucleoside-diphosphate-sugar epimerase
MIYLGNLIDAIIACAKHPRAAGQTFLVSDDNDVSTPDLIRMIAKEFGYPARLLPFSPTFFRIIGKIFGKTAAIDRLMGSLTVDICKIRSELDWQPPYTMSEGIKQTVKWYKTIKMRSM